jgi:ABC-type phosphonate transport system ATPase subunit
MLGNFPFERGLRNQMQDNLKMSDAEEQRLARVLLNRQDLSIIEAVSPEALRTMKSLCGPNGRFLLKVLLARHYGNTPDETTGADDVGGP